MRYFCRRHHCRTIGVTAYNNDTLLAWWNANARMNDAIIFTTTFLTDKPLFETVLGKVTASRKNLIMPSYQQTETERDYLRGKIDGLTYDLETWPQSQNEHLDIPASTAAMWNICKNERWLYTGGLSFNLSNATRVGQMATFTKVYAGFSAVLWQNNFAAYGSTMRDYWNWAGNPARFSMTVYCLDARTYEEIEALIESVNDFVTHYPLFHDNTDPQITKTQQLAHLIWRRPQQ